MAHRRLNNEIREYSNELPSGITKLTMRGDIMTKWAGTITGPEGTPYEGGKFDLLIDIPNEYPFRPPKVRFDTKVYHPNISFRGDICLDILKENWSVAFSLSTVLLAIRILLEIPNPNDPLEPPVAEVFVRDYEMFKSTATEWTQKYAM